MCSRYAYMYSWEELQQLLSSLSAPIPISKRYNLAPTQKAPVIRRHSDSSLKLDFLHWGLIPYFAVEPRAKSSMINARAETVASKPSFRAAFKARRCIVPVSGFYEWKSFDDDSGSQPYYIQSSDQEPLLFAGIYESWRDKKSILETFAIITTAANELFNSIHDRMPLILEPEDCEKWINPDTSVEEASQLLTPSIVHPLEIYPVSTFVNSDRNDEPKCIERIEIAGN